MQTAVFITLGVFLYVLLFTWLVQFLRYRITPRHFKVTLFGLCLRRIPLDEIESVSKKRHAVGWTENWWNTLHPNHRMLVIRRRRGLRRNLVITPRNRYVFKANLERALQRTSSSTDDAAEEEEEEEEATVFD